MKINSVYRIFSENPLAGLIVLAAALLSSSWVQAQSTLNVPRLDFDPTTFTGLAIVNPANKAVRLQQEWDNSASKLRDSLSRC